MSGERDGLPSFAAALSQVAGRLVGADRASIAFVGSLIAGALVGAAVAGAPIVRSRMGALSKPSPTDR